MGYGALMKAVRCLGLASLWLGACQAVAPAGPTRPPRPQAIASPGQASAPQAAPVAAAPSVVPVSAESAAPPPPSSPLPVLAQLQGRIQVDAAYLVAKGLGQLVGSGGGAVQVTGLLANHGAGGLSPDAAAGLVANHGGGLISNHGGALLSDASGGLLSNHGAGALGGTSFRLRQAGASLAVGQQLPAVGMAVRAFDLLSGRALPLVGPEGQALGAVLTGADGAYRLALASRPTGRVLVTAEVPGQADPRLALRTLALPQAEAEAPASEAGGLNEEENAAMGFIRFSFQRRLAEALAVPDLNQYDLGARWKVPEAVKGGFIAALEDLRAEAKAAGFLGLTEAQRDQVGAGAADAILSTMDFDAISLNPAIGLGWEGPNEPALPALVSVLRFTGAIAAQRLASDPKAFDADVDVVAHNAGRSPADAFQIRRPADFNAFFLEAFLSENTTPIARTRAFVTRYGSVVDPTTQLDQISRLRVGMDNVTHAVGQALLLPERGGRAAAVARIQAGCRALGAKPEAAASADAAASF